MKKQLLIYALSNLALSASAENISEYNRKQNSLNDVENTKYITKTNIKQLISNRDVSLDSLPNQPAYMEAHNLFYADYDPELAAVILNSKPLSGIDMNFVIDLANHESSDIYKKYTQDFETAKLALDEKDEILMRSKSILIDFDENKFSGNNLDLFYLLRKKYKAYLESNPELKNYELVFKDVEKNQLYLDWISDLEKFVKEMQENKMFVDPNQPMKIELKDINSDFITTLKGKAKSFIKRMPEVTKALEIEDLLGADFLKAFLREIDKLENINKIKELSGELKLDYSSNNPESIDRKNNIKERIEYLKNNHDTNGLSHYFVDKNFNQDNTFALAKEYKFSYSGADEISGADNFQKYIDIIKHKLGYELLIKLAHITHLENKQTVEQAIKRIKTLRGKKDIKDLTLKDLQDKDFQRELETLRKIEEYELNKYRDNSNGLDVGSNKYLTDEQLKEAKDYIKRIAQLKGVEVLQKDLELFKDKYFKQSNILRDLNKGISITEEQINNAIESLNKILPLYASDKNDSKFIKDLKFFNLDDEIKGLYFFLSRAQLLVTKGKNDSEIRKLKSIFKKDGTVNWTRIVDDYRIKEDIRWKIALKKMKEREGKIKEE